MKPEDVLLDHELLELWHKLIKLNGELNKLSKEKYNRINPFVENLFDWKNKGNLYGDKNITIYDSTTIVGDVSIGDNTWIGPFCSLDGTGGIKIGDYCSISSGVQILTHDTAVWALSGGKSPYEYGCISIGDCCFIGTQTIILKNTHIGNHCLIGANSLINRNVSDFSVVAGSPAKQIGEIFLDAYGQISVKYW